MTLKDFGVFFRRGGGVADEKIGQISSGRKKSGSIFISSVVGGAHVGVGVDVGIAVDNNISFDVSNCDSNYKQISVISYNSSVIYVSR